MQNNKVIELFYDESLITDLRQYPIDVNSPNSSKIRSLASKIILDSSNKIKKILSECDYLIIRNFSTQTIDAVRLARLLTDKIFYQGNELKYVHYFETQPFQNEVFSSSLACGAFHTDFWTRTDTPNYILIQCIETDPKHPYYSRNQVISVKNLLNNLERLHSKITTTLLNTKLPHKVKNNLSWIPLLTPIDDKLMIRLHPKYVAENMLSSEHYINGVAIHSLISDVAQSIADDFVLNTSDILIVSNKFCLHRRGEATVSFLESISKWSGRKVNTLRFF